MREFKYNQKLVKNYLLVSSVTTVLFIASIILPETKSTYVLLLPALLYFLFRNFTVITAYPDRVELKLAPLQSLKIIRYEEISDYSIDSKYINVTLKNSRIIKIPINLFNEIERDDAVNLFKENTGSR